MPNNQREASADTNKKKKKVAKKARRRPGRPKGSTNIKTRGRPAVARKKRLGRPAGSKKAGKRGRPARSGKASGRSIILPVSNDNLAYWSQMLKFLKENRGSQFIIQMDGDQYLLRAE